MRTLHSMRDLQTLGAVATVQLTEWDGHMRAGLILPAEVRPPNTLQVAGLTRGPVRVHCRAEAVCSDPLPRGRVLTVPQPEHVAYLPVRDDC